MCEHQELPAANTTLRFAATHVLAVLAEAVRPALRVDREGRVVVARAARRAGPVDPAHRARLAQVAPQVDQADQVDQEDRVTRVPSPVGRVDRVGPVVRPGHRVGLEGP